MEVNKFTFRLEWSEEDKLYLARCLEFPSLTVHGNSPEAALKEIKYVIRECLQSVEEDKKNRESRAKKRPTADEIADMADQGKDVTQYLSRPIRGGIRRARELDKMIEEDADKWDNSELGRDPELAIPAPDYARGGQSIATTLHLRPSTIRGLKKIADEREVSYRDLLRTILTEYVSNQ